MQRRDEQQPEAIAEQDEGFTGDEIHQIFRGAAMWALREEHPHEAEILDRMVGKFLAEPRR